MQGGLTVVRTDTIGGTDYLIVGTTPQNSVGSVAPFALLIYSLADPHNPVLVSNTASFPNPFNGVDYNFGFLSDMVVQGNTVLVPSTAFHTFGIVFDGQLGNVLAIDVSDPAAPQLEGVLFPGDTNADSLTNQFGATIVNGQIAYIASTTTTGGDTQNGVGRVVVVDYSDPTNLTDLGEVDIPVTYQVLAVAVQGNRALAVGRTGGDGGPDTNGSMTLSVLNITDPLHPQLIGTTLVSDALFTSSNDVEKISALPLGNGDFAVSSGSVNGSPSLILVDPSDPDNIVVTADPVPALVDEMSVSGAQLYTTSSAGLFIYDIGSISSIPFTASVEIPNTTGVAVVPGSFNIPPTQIIAGPTFDTLEWTQSLAFGEAAPTFTWQSTIANIQPGQALDVTLGGTVSFTSQGTAGLVPLPATTVTGKQVLSLSPATQTVAPGGTASYTVTVNNALSTDDDVSLVVLGLPTAWVQIPIDVLGDPAISLLVPANSSVQVTIPVLPDANATLGDYGFTVISSDDTSNQTTVQGDLLVAGTPPLFDPDSHAVVASLTPTQATAGQGTSALFTVRVTNTGSATETFNMSATGLPAGVVAAFSQTSIVVPPGTGNFRELQLRLTPPAGTAIGSHPFTVSAASITSNAQSTANGTLAIVGSGVSLTLDHSTGHPGDTFQATVRNTGTANDTFDLAVSGPAGLVATLGSSAVTLAPGQSVAVNVTTASASFAAQGELDLMVTATSHTNTAVRDSAQAALQIAPTTGFTAQFQPALQTLTVPGTADFALSVDNSGNSEDAYTATITGTTGGITAWLVGLDGRPTQTIPAFLLPGLSTGAIVLHTNSLTSGQGSVTVRITSAINGATASSTATVNVAAAVLPPTSLPQSVTTPSGTPRTISLVGTDPNAPPRSLTYTITTAPSHGTLGPVSGNSVVYTPTAGYSGADSFQFTVNNGAAASSTPAIVSLTVQAPVPVLVGYREFGVGAGAGHEADANFYNPDGSERFSQNVFPGLTGGVRVTSADFNGDGVADLVAGTGPGSISHVVVLDGVTGALLFSIQPFEDRFTGGVFVATGDLTGDGIPDLVISPDESGGPRVSVFSGAGFGRIADFFGIDDPDFRGGARAAVGDVNGDGVGDLVVSAGFGGGPRIAVFDGLSLSQTPTRLMPDFFLFEQTLRNGAYVAVGDIDGDGYADVIGGGGPGGGPRVLALSGRDLLTEPPASARVVANFFGGDQSNRGGIRVVARDLDGDNRADLVVGDGSGAGSRATGYLGKTITANGTPPEAFAFDAYPGFTGGVFVG